MTDETRTRPLRRPSTWFGASLALAAALAAGTAGYISGRADPGVTLHAQEVRAPRVLPDTTSYSPIVQQVAPAVVTVRVERRVAPMDTAVPPQLREFFGERLPRGMAPAQPRRAAGLGSGVVMRADGYIVTNAHVVGEAERVEVEFADRRTLPAEVVGVDEPTDLAVLKVGATDLPTVPLGDSSQVQVGDVVLAFGNPLGVGQTVTMGIVSAKGRTTALGGDSYQDFIQTDAPINQGNSGGALVNLAGELVGINAQILSRTGGNIGLGFAIPSTMVRSVTEQLMRDGAVRRSQLGVVVQGITPDLAEGLGLASPRGALVSEVTPGSPAAKAGLREGDVIVAIEGRDVEDANALRNQVASTAPGSRVAIDLLRDGDRMQVSAELAPQARQERPSTAGPSREGTGDARLGISAAPLTPSLAERLGVPRDTRGVAVTGVDADGPAARAGLAEGDVITRANGQDVRDVEALRGALAQRSDKPAVLQVLRDGRRLFVAVPPRG